MAVIHDVLFDFKFDPGAVATACLCIERRFLISARRSPLRSVDELRSAVRAGQVVRSPVELLAQEPAALFRLLNRPPAWIDGDDVRDLQQSAEEFSAAVGDSRALVERVELLQQELAAQVNEQTNRTLFVLTAVTVLALPINMVAGLFGMNVGGIPFAGRAHGFFFIAGTLIALTGVLIYVVFGKRRD